MEALTARALGPRDGKAGFLGSIGVRFMIDGAEAGQRVALVEHPMAARALAAPLHRHAREDEYSFVIEGSVGAPLGETVVIGKPARNQWHTFWNAGDGPARILEIISPAGSRNSSVNSLTLAVSPRPRQSSSPISARATGSRWTRAAFPGSSSASWCGSPESQFCRSQPDGRG